MIAFFVKVVSRVMGLGGGLGVACGLGAGFAAAAEGSALSAIALVADADFQRGVAARDRAGQPIVMGGGTGSGSPVWQVAQHHSRSDVTDPSHWTAHTGGFAFQDDYQRLSFHPESEADGADVILGLNAEREFAGRYRAKGDPWPHLYLSQRISAPEGHLGREAPSLAQLARVDLVLSCRLLRCRVSSAPGYDARIHAAQFVFFLTVQNLNRRSAGFGDYYWFGVLLYDDRVKVTERHVMQDRGSARKPATEKMIYDIGLRPFTSQVVADGGWVTVQGDLYPHLLAGIEEAWKRGYVGASRVLADYQVGSVVLGWEITGRHDAEMAVRGLRCVAVRKE